MDTDTDDVELTLDLEPEPGPDPPAPDVVCDPAAEAFARLEGELALMRRAVQHLAAERADIVIPDYGATLTDMAKRMGAIDGSLKSTSTPGNALWRPNNTPSAQSPSVRRWSSRITICTRCNVD